MLESERRLYGRCARLMVEGVVSHLDHTPGMLRRNGEEIPLPSPFFYHLHQSDLEDYAEQLEKLGLLLPLADPPGRACCFKVICSSAEAETLAYERALEGPPLMRLPASLFYFVGDRWNMTDEIGVEFSFDCYVQSILPAMCEPGYASRHERGYVWLPKFQDILAISVFAGGPNR